MLSIRNRNERSSDDHDGFVAGRYRDGAYSDVWTDVRRCTERTFVAYAAVCECGWRGTAQPPTPDGHRAARRSWLDDHARHLATTPGPSEHGRFPDHLIRPRRPGDREEVR